MLPAECSKFAVVFQQQNFFPNHSLWFTVVFCVGLRGISYQFCLFDNIFSFLFSFAHLSLMFVPFFYMLTVVFLCLFCLRASSSLSCSKYDSNMGANFDISDLVRTPDQPNYLVTDGDIPCTKDVVEPNFTYVFNVCGVVTRGMPTVCLAMDGLGEAAAVQVNNRGTPDDPSDDFCYLVGSYSQATTKVTLLDQNDPSHGISLTYYGEYCHSPRTQRHYRINLECADKLSAVPMHVYETSHCNYEVVMPSVYGCPLECPVANRRLCGGNGHCAFDSDKNGARCFCNKGYIGADCNSLDTTGSDESLNYSPALLGLIITLFVIIFLLVGGIVMMYKQLTAFKEDISHYQVLKGDDEHTTV